MNENVEPKTAGQGGGAETKGEAKLPATAHLLCGWPLVMVFIGGAIGGGLGGAAYAVNVGIYKSKLPVPAKVALNIITGVAAIGLWFAIAVAIQIARQ